MFDSLTNAINFPLPENNFLPQNYSLRHGVEFPLPSLIFMLFFKNKLLTDSHYLTALASFLTPHGGRIYLLSFK